MIKSEEWRKSEIAANRAAKKWKENGKPRDAQNILFLNKKQARTTLRAAVKTHYAMENNEMMQASFCDPTLFSILFN